MLVMVIKFKQPTDQTLIKTATKKTIKFLTGVIFLRPIIIIGYNVLD